MTRRRARALLMALAPALCLVACDDGELPPVTWHGEHVEFGAAPTLTPCAGTVDHLDRFAAFVKRELGDAELDAPPVPLLWVHDDVLDARCPELSGGCFDGDVALASSRAFEHELVHALLHQPYGDTYPLLAEGAAELLDDDFALAARDTPRLDPRTMLDGELPNYTTAGDLAAHLLSRYGPERLIALYDALSYRDSERRVRRRFAEIYGRSLDEVAEEFLAGPRCEDAVHPVRSFLCDSPRVAWEGARWSYTRVPACDEPDVRGDADGARATSVTLDIPSPGEHRVRWVIDERASAVLVSCSGCPWVPRYTLTGASELVLELDEGPYALWLQVEDPLLRRVGVSIEPER
ncbi:MAG: hypothetical protein H6713_18420 [Myxococcales bacterium]|nr:hypothetical protein [Myxococcales bacterium]